MTFRQNNSIKDPEKIPSMDDIVFKDRNKSYGAYQLRKKYAGRVFISLLLGIFILTAGSVFQLIRASSLKETKVHHERTVQINLQNLEKPNEIVAPPPPPPPEPPEVIKKMKYVAPVVVDSVKPEEAMQLMSADVAKESIENGNLADSVPEIKEDVEDSKTEDTEPFLVVQEMPEPKGGMPALYKYIQEHLVYPEEARDNNIQGKVYVRFCVTAAGKINQISIYKGVYASLDSAALKVVRTFPPFKPGKQNGRAVPVWFIVQINFALG
jgi:protein TonB